MWWWTLTYLDNDRSQTGLVVAAATNLQAHLMMAWATHEPSRKRRYRNVRGKSVPCGWVYIWDTPNLVEQDQSGYTFEHTFVTTPLQAHDHVWYYLFSTRTLYERYCQSALIHVPPPEVEMASARIFNSVDQVAYIHAFTTVHFDSVLYDDHNFYNPADPTKLTIPAGALYSFGANLALSTAASGKASLEILLNGGPPVTRHDHLIEDTGWAGATLSLQTDMPLHPDDFLQLRVYYAGMGNRDIKAAPNYSPHFWIRLVGAYPLSPP